MNFRYAANKREAFATTFLLFSFFYYLLTQGLIKHFMVPDLGTSISRIECNAQGCFAETGRVESKTRKIKINGREYRRFKFSEMVQIVLWSFYAVLLFIFRRHYYDRKNWVGIDGA
jgi:hypothetical protein